MSALEEQQPNPTCFHCGEVKTEAKMERLVTGEPSNCCADCWASYIAVSKQHINEMVNGGWARMVEKETEIAIEREAEKAKRKAEGKHAAPPVDEKDYGNLWLVNPYEDAGAE